MIDDYVKEHPEEVKGRTISIRNVLLEGEFETFGMLTQTYTKQVGDKVETRAKYTYIVTFTGKVHVWYRWIDSNGKGRDSKAIFHVKNACVASGELDLLIGISAAPRMPDPTPGLGPPAPPLLNQGAIPDPPAGPLPGGGAPSASPGAPPGGTGGGAPPAGPTTGGGAPPTVPPGAPPGGAGGGVPPAGPTTGGGAPPTGPTTGGGGKAKKPDRWWEFPPK